MLSAVKNGCYICWLWQTRQHQYSRLAKTCLILSTVLNSAPLEHKCARQEGPNLWWQWFAPLNSRGSAANGNSEDATTSPLTATGINLNTCDCSQPLLTVFLTKKQKANEWAKVWTNLMWWKITVTRSLLIRMASAIDFSVIPSMNWLKMSYYVLCQLPVEQKLHSTQSNYGWELSMLWSMPASFGNFLSSEALNHLKQASEGWRPKLASHDSALWSLPAELTKMQIHVAVKYRAGIQLKC